VPRIALDAMGGDHAPAETVAGAVAAAADGVNVVLVGDEEVLAQELRGQGAELPLVHAPDTVGMGEDAARAIRDRPGSSVVVCARMVREGDAAGFVSAGSTGAAMAAAAIVTGRVPGVLRPTIASVIPKPTGRTVVLDSGANPEVKPEHLVQFAEMGAAFVEAYYGVATPKVGLLSNGEEKGKGRLLEKEAHELLEAAPVCFVGNVEGRDIASPEVDVIVTDGFTGNVLLKTTEGVASMVASMVMSALANTPPEAAAAVLPTLLPIREQLDYESTGGAHLLGAAGVVVIAHGSSSRKSIRNALCMARDGAVSDLVAKVAAHIGAR
jgi:glycerol-3-phosphate acyltransferase PlsX